jgi:iron complex outermembrane receptor protein
MRTALLPHFRLAPLSLAISVVLGVATSQSIPAFAQTTASAPGARSIAITAQPLANALNELARQADLQLGFPASLVAGKNAPAVSGQFTAQQALDRLLAGSGLEGFVRDQAVIVRPVTTGASSEVTLSTVQVTANASGTSEISAPYAGGQVARGGRIGMLGNRSTMDTPFSTTQYTSQLIDDQQAKTIGDVLVNDPSVRNTYGRTAGREEFNIRGFTLYNYDVSYNGLYGVSPRNASSVIGVERVEVLRGPNSLLNGMAPAGSVGGSINLVPKRAGAEPLNRLTLSYVGESQLGVHGDISRRLGAAQQWGVRLNVAKNSGDTPINGSSERVDAAALGLDYQGDRVRLEADVNYQNRVTHGRSSLLFPSASAPMPAAPDNKTNLQPKWSYWDSKELSAVFRGEVDVAPGLVAYAAVGAMQYDFDSLQTSSQLTDEQGNIIIRPYRLKEHITTHTLEAGVRSKFNTGPLSHELVFSASSYAQNNDLLRRNGNVSSSNIYTPVTFDEPDLALSGSIPSVSETRLRSLALADTIFFADRRFQLTLGARHQQMVVYSLNGQSPNYDKSVVTPMVSALFKATDAVSVYANYIEGLSQGMTAPQGTSNAGEMFAPTKSKQIEVGTKLDTGRFATTVSLFQIEQAVGIIDGLTYRMNGSQRNRGLEVATQGVVANGVRLLGGVAYTQSKQLKTEGGTNDGRTAMATPRLQINVGGEWDTSFLPGLTLTALALRTSSQFVDAANTQSLPAWTRVDIGARYRFTAGGKPVTLRASIENLQDKSYWLSAARQGLTMGAPRTLLLSASTDF